MEEGRTAFKALTGSTAGKRPLGKPARRRGDNIKNYLTEWVGSAQSRIYWITFLNAALDLRVP